MLESLQNSEKKVVGTKQLLRALTKDQVTHVFVAEDADEFVYRRVRGAAEEAQVPVTVVKTMKELGQAAKVQVPTAAAGILR